jgi:hypothetical protein
VSEENQLFPKKLRYRGINDHPISGESPPYHRPEEERWLLNLVYKGRGPVELKRCTVHSVWVHFDQGVKAFKSYDNDWHHQGKGCMLSGPYPLDQIAKWNPAFDAVYRNVKGMKESLDRGAEHIQTRGMSMVDSRTRLIVSEDGSEFKSSKDHFGLVEGKEVTVPEGYELTAHGLRKRVVKELDVEE